MFLYHIGKAFNIHGFSLFTNNACASGLYALETARLMIEGGNNKAVIVAAADYPDVYQHLWFKALNMYPPDGLTRPFDKDAQGFVLGQGGVGLVLEDIDHALQRNAHIYAEYKGGGFLMEGWKVAFPDLKGHTYSETIQEALKRSYIEPEAIDLICVHGVGTKIADRYEADTIADIFGTNQDRPKITAFKPYIGHTLGASVLLETAIMLLAMEKNIIPPLINTKNIDKKIRISPALQKKVFPIQKALKICSAFAGFNASVVFEKLKV
jgi:3-oxoacyl-(acyl-carrier-protein) synthase